MTNNTDISNDYTCRAEDVLKLLAGKWKPQIFKIASQGPVRFNTLLRQLPDANKQSLSVALRELEGAGMLIKETITEKPLHIEYTLSDHGKSMVNIYKQIAAFTGEDERNCDSTT